VDFDMRQPNTSPLMLGLRRSRVLYALKGISSLQVGNAGYSF
jgi:hypothetical protein